MEEGEGGEMSLSCLAHGGGRLAGQASATLLGLGALQLMSGPAGARSGAHGSHTRRVTGIKPHGQELHKTDGMVPRKSELPLWAQGMGHAMYMSGGPEQGSHWAQVHATKWLRDCHSVHS